MVKMPTDEELDELYKTGDDEMRALIDKLRAMREHRKQFLKENPNFNPERERKIIEALDAMLLIERDYAKILDNIISGNETKITTLKIENTSNEIFISHYPIYLCEDYYLHDEPTAKRFITIVKAIEATSLIRIEAAVDVNGNIIILFIRIIDNPSEAFKHFDIQDSKRTLRKITSAEYDQYIVNFKNFIHNTL